ncbi:hypothetical protein JOC77_002532 [Peribacillus deserti]|uniref:Uncharacterized protein n=1 Tax=Peribacillus deserti TaxID=673318 RepID=A0ABS2QIV8_9BACI|nr:hypothetical protein [Peribacillus deserti]
MEAENSGSSFNEIHLQRKRTFLKWVNNYVYQIGWYRGASSSLYAGDRLFYFA